MTADQEQQPDSTVGSSWVDVSTNAVGEVEVATLRAVLFIPMELPRLTADQQKEADLLRWRARYDPVIMGPSWNDEEKLES